MDEQLICCYVGTGLLLLSIIVCIFSDNDIFWRVILLIGEIIAFLGYAPVIFGLKLFG